MSLCPTSALGFEDHDPSRTGPRLPGFTPTEIGPAIRFAPLRRQSPPAMAAATGRGLAEWVLVMEPGHRSAVLGVGPQADTKTYLIGEMAGVLGGTR